MTDCKASLVLVANWDSDAGYAWWLMESYWRCLSLAYAPLCPVFLAYPSISKLPPAIQASPIACIELDFTKTDVNAVRAQAAFIHQHQVKTLYFSDQAFWHWRYLLFRLLGVRCIVVHDHTPGLRPAVRGIKRGLKQLIFRLPGLSANAVFGATSFVRQRAINVACVPPERCYSIPNGLPALSEDKKADVHTLFGIPRDRRILTSVARATVYKGIPFVLECLAQLVRERGVTDLHFLYCGDGPDLESFKRHAAELGIAEYVSFAGRRSDVSELLGGCHFAIQPSQGEVGYSLSILEYMRAGLPVIVPDNPSVCMATEDGINGLIYQEGNVESATNAIYKLIKSPETVSMLGKNAKQAVQEVFSLQVAHQKLLNSMQIVDPMMHRLQGGDSQ